MKRTSLGIRFGRSSIVLALMLLSAGAATAQDVALPEPVSPTAAPTNKNGEPEIALDADKQIDLANIVTSAAKGVTTVQEAPAIITVITADEIKQRGFHYINDVLATVPGWLDDTAEGNMVPLPQVRGVGQAALLLRDGVSMFDPWANIASLNRTQPLETLKRVEVVTGPGGVLWGANSFLGIVNLISKDAEDVNGLEVNAGYGDGPGNRQDFRAYAMFGKTFFHDKLKIFQHVSYENYVGAVSELPLFLANSPAPQPAGQGFYGPLTSAFPQRTSLLTIDGKYTLGPVSLYYSVPIGDTHEQLGFNNGAHSNGFWTSTDRYAILEYKGRFLRDRFGIDAKGYWTQFNRNYGPQLFPPSSLFPPFTNPNGTQNIGGLNLDFTHHLIQRYGATLDADVNLPAHLRLLAGGEFFVESVNNSINLFPSPESPADLPLLCPVNPDGTPISGCPRQLTNDVDRLVGAVYADLQWHPLSKLVFDGGVRLQEGFGGRPYQLTPLYSGAVVWSILRDLHLKANYATGFRAPVFLNTDAPQGGVEWGANPNLKNESSQSFQGEVNAQLLRNVRKVRVLEVRVDYSYTVLSDLIQIINGSYQNSGKRAIHSVEGWSRLYLAGDHFLQASYTYLNAWSTDRGDQRNAPNQWFTVGGSFNLIRNFLDVNANLNVLGAYEDPNIYPATMGGVPGATTSAGPTSLTMDRLTPVALLQLGAHVRLFKEKVELNAQFYNLLNQHYWFPDYFYDLTPTVEQTPTPAPGFNFFASVTYHP